MPSAPLQYPWIVTLAWLVASRLAIALVGFVGVAAFVDHDTLLVGGPAALDYEHVWHKWDAIWYERIAVYGYAYQLDDLKGQAAAAFFPLYPLTVGLLLKLFPSASFFWLGSLMSLLFAFAGLGLAAQHLTRDLPHAERMVLLTMTSAGSFYLGLPYTEGLFLLLVVLVLMATRRKRLVLAGLLAGLAAVTRAHGLALIAVPAFVCLLDSPQPSRARIARLAAVGGAFAAPVLLYMAYMAGVQGSPDAFVERQAMWNNAVPYPLKSLAGVMFDHPRRVGAYLHGGFWLLYAALLARYARRLPVGEAVFCAGALLISTQQESFQGIYRYITPLVPLTLAIADDTPGVQRAVLILNLVFGTIMILAFVTNNRLAV